MGTKKSKATKATNGAANARASKGGDGDLLGTEPWHEGATTHGVSLGMLLLRVVADTASPGDVIGGALETLAADLRLLSGVEESGDDDELRYAVLRAARRLEVIAELRRRIVAEERARA